MDDPDSLASEQLKHMVDLIYAKLDCIELNQVLLREMIEQRINYLETQGDDHEVCIRAATEGVAQLKVRSGLTSAGSGVLSIMAVIKSFIGG